jgi:hypothetical protein
MAAAESKVENDSPIEGNDNEIVSEENKGEENKEEENKEEENKGEENKEGEEKQQEVTKETETKPLIVYSELCDVIDKFLSSENQLLPTNTIKTGQTMYKLKQYKDRLQKTIDNENKGNRLGRLVRSHVIKHFASTLLQQSKFTYEE